jgi:hypothetical protein
MFADVLGRLVEPERDDGSRCAYRESDTKLDCVRIVLAGAADDLPTGVDAHLRTGRGCLGDQAYKRRNRKK